LKEPALACIGIFDTSYFFPGGVIAIGRIPRGLLLELFAGSQGRSVATSQRVRVLITTDLLSEGVNLQEASVVVHADIPWSPARMEQRVGRVRRIGSRHERVTVYALAPPAPTELVIGIEARLRAKIGHAARTIGLSGSILPRLFADLPRGQAPSAESVNRFADALRPWLSDE
jgi:superfamily II DNA/RNA helicase